MNIKGKLVEKFETVQITETFKKREFIIQENKNPEYPEYIKVELIHGLFGSRPKAEICSLLMSQTQISRRSAIPDFYFSSLGHCKAGLATAIGSWSRAAMWLTGET